MGNMDLKVCAAPAMYRSVDVGVTKTLSMTRESVRRMDSVERNDTAPYLRHAIEHC